ncbi:MAG: FMN-binding protein [Candidatus Izemoplasmataceae bacterium]
MLAKFKTAFVLLIIGMVSGGLIWGTNALTEERIERNRELARLTVYVEMYPTLDPNNIVEEDIAHSAVTQKLTFYDNNGNLLGYAFRGTDNNAFGYVNVVVGINRSGKIVGVTITETTNTTTYVSGIVNNYLPNFTNQDIANLSYDSSTGATSTYTSVRKIVEASIILVAGDPILEEYQTIFDNADRYEEAASFTAGTITSEVAIYDGDNTIIGYVYQGLINIGGTDYLIGFAVNTDKEFIGVLALDEDVPNDLITAFSALDAYIGEHVSTITLDLTGTIEEVLETLAAHAFLRADEDENLRTIRNYIIEAASIGDSVTIDHTILTGSRPLYDSEDVLIGYVYSVDARGYGFFEYGQVLELEIGLYLDGTVASIIVGEHRESSGIADPAFNSIPGFIGLDDVNDFNRDVYAGASETGDAIYNAVRDAQTHLRERDGE